MKLGQERRCGDEGRWPETGESGRFGVLLLADALVMFIAFASF
ncbi:hypothetical protein [Sphingosinithalassobacter sp. CS137]|nr:hypothetical protein [Sphingosinithalassobacter sp. CS137]